MKILENISANFVTKILKDMESLSDKIEHNEELSIINKAQKDLDNKEILKKLYSKQLLLTLLKGLF